MRVNHPNRRRKMTSCARWSGTNTAAPIATQGLSSRGEPSRSTPRVCSSAPHHSPSKRTGRRPSLPSGSSSAPRYDSAVEERSSWRSLMASGGACATLLDLRWSTLTRRMRMCLLVRLMRGVKVRLRWRLTKVVGAARNEDRRLCLRCVYVFIPAISTPIF